MCCCWGRLVSSAAQCSDAFSEANQCIAAQRRNSSAHTQHVVPGSGVCCTAAACCAQAQLTDQLHVGCKQTLSWSLMLHMLPGHCHLYCHIHCYSHWPLSDAAAA